MQNPLKDFFTYTKGERQGLLALAILIIVLLIAPYMYRLLLPADNELDAIKASLLLKENSIASENSTPEDVELFYFNPNEASREELLMLGIPEKSVTSIINYRDKGGKFYQRDDLLKIFSLSKEEYLRIRKYIKLNENFSYSPFNNKEKENIYVNINIADSAELTKISGIGPVFASRIIKYREKLGGFDQKEDLKQVYGIDEDIYKKISPYIYLTPVAKEKAVAESKASYVAESLVNINTADSIQLTRVKGIGPVFAARIMKYRNLLGGYIAVDQLLEVYGMKPENFELIAPQVKVDLDQLRKININSATFYDLKSHPYINAALADYIISYRTKNKQFSTTAELRNSFLVDDDLYRKLAPYIEL